MSGQADKNLAVEPAIQRFYIMAMAATGKSTFTDKHDSYLGYRVVDFGEDLPKRRLSTRILLYVARFVPPLRLALQNRPDMKDRFRHAYFDQAFDFLTSREEPTILLGRRTRENYRELVEQHDSVRFAMVLIPEENHRRNCAARKKKMRNPIPYFHHWTTDFSKILKIRKQMSDYAREFDIPVYDDIESAIQAMHRQYGVETNSD